MTHGPWWMVGPAIGILVVLMLWTLNKPLGALGGWVDLEAWLRAPSRAQTWRLWFLFGVIGGGLAYALATGGFAPGVANEPLAARLGGGTSAVAGAAIGFGARVASGCTSGHGISGTALGSPASLVSCATFMGVAVATAHTIAWLAGGA